METLQRQSRGTKDFSWVGISGIQLQFHKTEISPEHSAECVAVS